MKNSILFIFLILFNATVLGQEKEKIKGTKIVTVEQKEVKPFENLEVEEMNRSFSLGNQNAFIIEIPQADLKKVQ